MHQIKYTHMIYVHGYVKLGVHFLFWAFDDFSLTLKFEEVQKFEFLLQHYTCLVNCLITSAHDMGYNILDCDSRTKNRSAVNIFEPTGAS